MEVVVETVPNEALAELTCNHLRANGIRCYWREAGDLSGGLAANTLVEIVVDESDFERARELLDVDEPESK
jgi:hypothetical protein